MTQKPTKVVLISYVPLLDYRVINQNITIEKLAELLQGDAYNSKADTCLWLQWEGSDAYKGHKIKDGTIFPVLGIDNANNIAAHLKEWSEGNPERWFDLVIADSIGRTDVLSNRYCVVLMPKYEESVARWKLKYLATNGEFAPMDTEFDVVSRPLAFGSGGASTYSKIVDKLTPVGQSMPVGVVDMELVYEKDNTKIMDNITIIGTFNRAYQDKHKDWTDSFINTLTAHN